MANMYKINDLHWTMKDRPEWFTRALFGGRLIQSGIVRVLTGIKGDELLNQIDIESKVLQIDGKDCAWTPNQIIKLSDKQVSVKTYKINLEQCIDTLENKRTAYMLSAGANNDSLPAELEDATMMLIAIQLSNEIEELIIAGSATANPDHFDGAKTILLKAGSKAIKVPGATITAANVITSTESVYAALPENVLQAEDTGDLYALVSYATRRKLRSALAEKNNQVMFPMWTLDDGDKRNPKMFYNGMEVVAVKGIGDNTIIGIAANNMYLLTDLLEDTENVEMGQFPKPNDNKVWIKGRLRLGFEIPFEDEAVIFDPSITVASGGHTFPTLALSRNSLIFNSDEEQVKTLTITNSTGNTTLTLNAQDLELYRVNGEEAGESVPLLTAALSGSGATRTLTVTLNEVGYTGKEVITTEVTVTDGLGNSATIPITLQPFADYEEVIP